MYGVKLCRELHLLCTADPRAELGGLFVAGVGGGVTGVGVWYQDREVVHDMSKGIKNY